jgi:hypothetical protein
MTSDQASVACGGCGAILPEATNLDPALRKPCPACGSLRRSIEVQIEDSVTFHFLIGVAHKGKRAGVRGRRLVEMKAGDSLSDDGTWAHLEQLVDHVHRRYRKLVVAADGRMIKDVDGPIEDQDAHGPQREQPAP